MLTVAPGGNNLATICYKDFLGLATINMYYYYYYYYYYYIYDCDSRSLKIQKFHNIRKTENFNKTEWHGDG